MSNNVQFTVQNAGSCCVCYKEAGGGTELLGHAIKEIVHAVCSPCLEQWMNESRKCPICRANITHVNGVVLEPVQNPVDEIVIDELEDDEASLIGISVAGPVEESIGEYDPDEEFDESITAALMNNEDNGLLYYNVVNVSQNNLND